MTTTDQDADISVAREIYPLAVKQAREQVVIEAVVILPFAILFALAGFPRSALVMSGVMGRGILATAYDIRWWLWLRRADPVEGYRRLQARPKREGGRFATHVTLALAVVGLTLWFVLPR